MTIHSGGQSNTRATARRPAQRGPSGPSKSTNGAPTRGPARTARPQPQPPQPVAAPPSAAGERGWGAAITAALAPTGRRLWRTLPASWSAPGPQRQRLTRLAQTIAPLVVVALVALTLAVVHYQQQGFGRSPGIVGFAEVSQGDARRLGIPQLAINNDTGYDGQFFFYLAFRPSIITTCPHDAATCPAYEPVYRWQRILYPMTARVLALGQPTLIPYTLLLVNLLTLLATALLVGALAVEAGASRWLGAAAGLFCGELLGFLRDLSDPFGVLWLIVAVYLMRHQRPRWAGVALAAALLTREQLIFFTPLLVFPLLLQRRWLTLAQTLALTFIPFGAWQFVLHALYGQWPLLSSDTKVATITPYPFAGLLATRHDFDFGVTLLCGGLPLLASALVASVALWRQSLRGILRDPLPLLTLLYCALFSLVSYPQWADIWGAGRLELPGVALATIVLAPLPSSRLRVAFASLLVFTAFAPLVEFLR